MYGAIGCYSFMELKSRNMNSCFYNDHALLLRAIKTKPFILLSGSSGSGKSRLVRELAYMSCPKELQDKDGTEPGNFCMIEVNHSWNDSKGLLGTLNDSSRYEMTPFVKFLIKAKLSPGVPFFICLDNMHFSKPEQYLAEVLRVFDTRRYVEKKDAGTGRVSTNKESRGSVKTATLIDAQCLKKPHRFNFLSGEGLGLPENAIIIGTVNMDDAGHKFSRNVIDRALTIEISNGRLSDIFGKSERLNYRSAGDILSFEKFRSNYVTADDAVARCVKMRPFVHLVTGDEQSPDTLSASLRQIAECLEGTPYQLSYRVMNDLVVYLAVLLDEEAEDQLTEARFRQLMRTAVDDIFRMKVLPRYYIHSEDGYLDAEGVSNSGDSPAACPDKVFEPDVPYGKGKGIDADTVVLIGYSRNPLMVRIKRRYHIRAFVAGRAYGMSADYNKARLLLLHGSHGERELYTILGSPRTVFGSEIASLGMNPNAHPTDQYLLYDIGEQVSLDGFDIQSVKLGTGVAFSLPHFRKLSNPDV